MALDLRNQVFPKYDFYEKATKSLEGGGLPHEMGGGARRKFWIKPPKETNPRVAQPFCDT